jgi:hypothetical protein
MILPTPTDVREARIEINFTQKRAAGMVHATESSWSNWEALFDSFNYRQIGGASWELFLRKTDSRRPIGSRFKLRQGI